MFRWARERLSGLLNDQKERRYTMSKRKVDTKSTKTVNAEAVAPATPEEAKKPRKGTLFKEWLQELLGMSEGASKETVEIVIAKAKELAIITSPGGKGKASALDLTNDQLGFLIVTKVSDLSEIEDIPEETLEAVASIVAEKELVPEDTKLRKIASKLGKDHVVALFAAYVNHLTAKYAAKS